MITSAFKRAPPREETENKKEAIGETKGLFTPVSLGYPLSVFNKNSTLKGTEAKKLAFINATGTLSKNQ